MARKFIDVRKLELLASQGNGVSEIARILGVSKGAVSKRLKDMNIAVSRDIATRTAPIIVNEKIDAMGELKRVNKMVNAELTYLEGEIANADAEKREGLQNQKLKHIAEIRKQINLLLNIMTTMYRAEEVAAFQQIVLDEIGQADPQTRQRILNRLNDARSIRASVAMPGSNF